MRMLDLRLQNTQVRRKSSHCDLTLVITLDSHLRLLEILVDAEVHRSSIDQGFGLRMRLRYDFTMGLSS